MFIEQAYKAKHELWRYVLGIIMIAAAYIIGQLPLTGAWLIAVGADGLTNATQSDLYKILNSNTTLFFMLFTFFIAIIGMFVVIRFWHQQDIREVTTTRSRVDWKRILGMFFVMLFVISVMTVVDYQTNGTDYVWNFKWEAFLYMCLIAIPLIPIQSAFEEYAFRGYLMQGLGILSKNRWFPLLMTSVLFGAMHFMNPEVDKLGPIIMVYYIGTGLFLGIITLMDEGMELAIGFHAANNLATALLVTADWTALQTNSILKDISEPSAGVDILIPVLVLYPIILLILAKRYKWTGWKDKLFGKLQPIS